MKRRRACLPTLSALEGRVLLSGIPPEPSESINVQTLRQFYGLDGLTFTAPGGGTIPAEGQGQTIVIITGDCVDPNYVDSDSPDWMSSPLAEYSIANGLPYNASGTNSDFSFTMVDQDGQSGSIPTGQNTEFDLDTQAVHTAAPLANIIDVVAENESTDYSNMLAAVQYAISLKPAAITMSYGLPEFTGTAGTPSAWVWGANVPGAATTPASPYVYGNGTTYAVAAGDYGGGMQYFGAGHTDLGYWPMMSPDDNPSVVQVGGTNLSYSDGTYTDVAWGNGNDSYYGHTHPGNGGGGTGGGYSQEFTRPIYQTLSPYVNANQSSFPTESIGQRLGPDVSMLSQPVLEFLETTGTSGNYTTAWVQDGGTSLATPLFAGVMGVVDQGRELAGEPALSSADTLYFLYQAPSSDFYDITQGNTGYQAMPGYDLASGRGDVQVGLIHDLVSAAYSTTTQLGVAGPSTIQPGQAVTLTATVAGPTQVAQGVVMFMDNGQLLGTAPLGADGTATLTTDLTIGGTNDLTVVYAAQGLFQASNSAPSTVTVSTNPGPTPGPNPAPIPGAGPLVVGVGGGHHQGSWIAVLGPDGQVQERLTPFGPDFHGSIRVTTGDVTGDGVADIIAATGPGGPGEVVVYSGSTLQPIAEFAPAGPNYRGGLSVAAADLDGNGIDEIVVGQSKGTGIVRVFEQDGSLISSFQAFRKAHGGVSVAAGSATAGGIGEIIVGAGSGRSPRVEVFAGLATRPTTNFLASAPGDRDGVSVGYAWLDNQAVIATGPASAAAPRIRLWGMEGQPMSKFLAWRSSGSTGGVQFGSSSTAGQAPVLTVSSGSGARFALFTGLPPSRQTTAMIV